MLGKGSYGKVKQVAIKEYGKDGISYTIQECCVLRYLSDCEYVVRLVGFDLFNNTITTQLYDCSLSRMVKSTQNKDKSYSFTSSLSKTDALKVVKCILLGLTEIHDRNLVHGDLKPCNMLLDKSTMKAVICDFGFCSVAKYSKVRLVTPTYKDPKCMGDKYSDLYALGVCLIEILGGVIHYDPDEDPKKYLPNVSQRGFLGWIPTIESLLSIKRNSRPDARKILATMYSVKAPLYTYKGIDLIYKSDYDTLYKYVLSIEAKSDIYEGKYLMKTETAKLARKNKVYYALMEYLHRNQIPKSQHEKYALMGCAICCSLFQTKYRYYVTDMEKLTGEELSILTSLINDDTFLSVLFSPSS
jgi:serine/threonine protein kinase